MENSKSEQHGTPRGANSGHDPKDRLVNGRENRSFEETDNFGFGKYDYGNEANCNRGENNRSFDPEYESGEFRTNASDPQAPLVRSRH